MTFHFLLFTITIHKRTYTEQELQQIIHDNHVLAQVDHYRTKYWN
ncbi:YrzI family small protein [Halalkalibacter sp. MEB205]|uniref:YrzI family small protein n=1 Tax=Halalkalibacter alkaliphilus TaxID=2917993 RepID=A0A9X2CUA6_9BACI|nr:YrzI family small protein [Halalkalibacter alkaliphilus]MCL7748392.1 YrzI family small protein [Halalkalibacter alkaliphilus]